MSKRKKRGRRIQDWETRKRWHICRHYGKRFIVFRHQGGATLARMLPKGFRFTRADRAELIRDARAEAAIEHAAMLHGVGHA